VVSALGYPFNNLSGIALRNAGSGQPPHPSRGYDMELLWLFSVDSSVLIIRCSVAKLNENFASVKALWCRMAGRGVHVIKISPDPPKPTHPFDRMVR